MLSFTWRVSKATPDFRVSLAAQQSRDGPGSQVRARGQRVDKELSASLLSHPEQDLDNSEQ